jgi:hypothetical protein
MPKSFDNFERNRKGDKSRGTRELFGKNTPRGLRIRMEKQTNTEINKVSKPKSKLKSNKGY